MQKIDLLVIGSEVLNGFTLDTNTQFITSELFKLGYRINRSFTVRDNKDNILDMLYQLYRDTDLVITTGGLGPTQDDMTVDILCKFMGREPVYSPYAKRKAEILFQKRAKDSKKIDLDWGRIFRQTRIPKGTKALKNQVGLAPGIWIKEIPLLALPGFPIEIKSIWPHALKKIQELKLEKTNTITLPIWGVGESQLFSALKFPDGIEIGVHSLGYGCRLFLSSSDEKTLKEFESEIRKSYAGYITKNPLEAFSGYCMENKKWLSVVESCTGGLCSEQITQISGASSYYRGGIISYHNKIKESLGVSSRTLEKYGAVSEQTAFEMARQGLEKLDANICLAVTGVAGPTGGTKEKPVGTVYIAIADRDERKVWVAKLFFPFGRERFRKAVAHYSFLALYQKYVFFKDLGNWEKKGLGKEFLSFDIS